MSCNCYRNEGYLWQKASAPSQKSVCEHKSKVQRLQLVLILWGYCTKLHYVAQLLLLSVFTSPPIPKPLSNTNQDLGSPKWTQLMLYRSISSVCQEKVVFHMPKYRYGVFTPWMDTPQSSSITSKIEFRWPMFHSSTPQEIRNNSQIGVDPADW